MSIEQNIVQILEEALSVQSLIPLPRDVSPRHYYRGRYRGESCIVMSYPEASDNNLAELSEFIRIGTWLSARGIKVPKLLARNDILCAAAFEDLGTSSFGYSLHSGGLAPSDIYEMATDVLCILRDAEPLGNLPNYNSSRIVENYRQFVDYYIAMKRKDGTPDGLAQSFLNVLSGIEQSLDPCPKGFVHGDYHLENVMLYCDQPALIDYQDAFLGPLPYDLLNLLEDARVDVPLDIKSAMISLYCRDMNERDAKNFMDWYRVLAVQFHCRVIGLFIKLAAEQGRDSYLVHIPRLQNYIVGALDEPVLEPLKRWMQKEGVDFAPVNDLDGDYIRNIFRNMSF